MTPEEAALRKAVRDNPEDDTVRLAFADWLDEHARSDRAAFIRAQIHVQSRLEKVGFKTSPDGTVWPNAGVCETLNCLWPASRKELEDTYCLYHQAVQIQLLGYGLDKLFRPWPDDFPGLDVFADLKDVSVVYRRGFPYAIGLPCAKFVKLAAALCTNPLGSVSLTDKHFRTTTPGGHAYGWELQIFGVNEPYDLPAAIWRCLRPQPPDITMDVYGFYASETEAHDALSKACLLYGNQLIAKGKE